MKFYLNTPSILAASWSITDRPEDLNFDDGSGITSLYSPFPQVLDLDNPSDPIVYEVETPSTYQPDAMVIYGEDTFTSWVAKHDTDPDLADNGPLTQVSSTQWRYLERSDITTGYDTQEINLTGSGNIQHLAFISRILSNISGYFSYRVQFSPRYANADAYQQMIELGQTDTQFTLSWTGLSISEANTLSELIRTKQATILYVIPESESLDGGFGIIALKDLEATFQHRTRNGNNIELTINGNQIGNF